MSGPKLLAALLLLAAGAAGSWRLHRPGPVADAQRLGHVPAQIGSWRGRDVPVSERQHALLETRDVLLREYADGGDEVLACVAAAGPSSKAAHPPEICYRGQGWRIEAQRERALPLAGRDRRLLELVIEQDGRRHLVWSWYRVRGEETASWWREQWLAVLARLAGDESPAALLRFSTPMLGPPADGAVVAARARLARFLETFLPQVDAALAAPPPGREAAGERR